MQTSPALSFLGVNTMAIAAGLLPVPPPLSTIPPRAIRVAISLPRCGEPPAPPGERAEPAEPPVPSPR